MIDAPGPPTACAGMAGLSLILAAGAYRLGGVEPAFGFLVASLLLSAIQGCLWLAYCWGGAGRRSLPSSRRLMEEEQIRLQARGWLERTAAQEREIKWATRPRCGVPGCSERHLTHAGSRFCREFYEAMAGARN